jgi:hypothetical protein
MSMRAYRFARLSMTQQSPFEDIDPIETHEWLESIDSVMRAQGPQRAHFLLEKLVDFTRRSGAYLPFKPNTAYLNTISKAQEPDYPGDRSLGAAQRGLHPLERNGHGGAGEPREFRVRRPHRELRVGCNAVRSRLQPFLACPQRHASRRYDLHSGPFESRHLRARVSRGPAQREPVTAFPAGSRRRRTFVLSASLVDAGFLAISRRSRWAWGR